MAVGRFAIWSVSFLTGVSVIRLSLCIIWPHRSTT